MVYLSSRRGAMLSRLLLCGVLGALVEGMASPIAPPLMAMESGVAQPIESDWTPMELKPVGLPHSLGKYPLSKWADRVRLKQDVPSLSIPFDQSGTLAEGDEMSGDGWVFDVYRFQGQANQIIRVTLTSDAFNTYLLLVDGNQELMASNDDSDGTNSALIAQLAQSGDYYLLVRAYGAEGRGDYQIKAGLGNETELRGFEQKAEAERLYSEALGLWRVSRWQEALGLWEQALALYRDVGVRDAFPQESRRGEVRTLTGLGKIADDFGQYSQSLDYYQQSLEIIREIGDRAREGQTLNHIGGIYHQLGDYTQALDYYQQSLGIIREIGDSPEERLRQRAGEGTTLNNIGLTYDNLGDYPQALDYYQQSLEIIREFGDQTTEGVTLNNIGSTYSKLGDYPQALDYYQQSLGIIREFGDRATEGTTLNNIGSTYDLLGEYLQALDYYQQALGIFKEIGDRAGEGTTLNNIGLIYDNLGDYPQALDYYQQSLGILREFGDSPEERLRQRTGEGTTLNNIGGIYDNLGDYPQALDYYQQSLGIIREISDRAGEGTTLNNIGNTYDSLGDYPQALDYYQQSLGIRREIGDRAGEGTTLNNIGGTYSKLGDYPQALDYYQQSLGIRREIGDRAGEGTTLNNIGNTYDSLGDYPQALDYYQQSLGIRREIGDRAGEGTTLNNIGNLLESTEQAELAVVFLKESVNVFETIRADNQSLSSELQKSYTDTIASAYRKLADLLLEQGRILEAQQVLEMLKVKELETHTRSQINETTGKIELTDLEAEIFDEHGGIIGLGQAIAQCKQDSDCSEVQLDTLLDRRRALQAAFDDDVKTLEVQLRERSLFDHTALLYGQFTGIANRIVNAQPGTVLIYPFVTEDKLWVLWATGGDDIRGPIVNSIPVPVTQGELAQTVSHFRTLMNLCESGRCGPVEDVQAVSEQLYHWLIPEPLQQELATNEIHNLVFSLDRVIRYVPMVALYDGNQYLTQRYNISTVISAGLTSPDSPLPPGTTNNSVLALGLSDAVPDYDPTDNVSGFNALAHVPAELESIVQGSVQEGDRTSTANGIYPGAALLNETFDTRAFRQLGNGAYNILHIATHGAFVPARSNQSYLMLGTKQPLRIEDLKAYSPDFTNLSMVVLSACQSALAEPDQDGIEINSLAHVFTSAWVDTVVASLWLVDDQSTRLLMEAFYAELANSTAEKPITISQALRSAQRRLLEPPNDAANKDSSDTQRGITLEFPEGEPSTAPTPTSRYAHPYYWAPFIIIGNGL